MRLGIVSSQGSRRLTPEGFARNARSQIWESVRRGMQGAGEKIAARARISVRSALRGNRAANSIRHRVFSRDRTRLPTMEIGSTIPWLGIHERGGVISGSMLIPFGKTRMRRKAWKEFIDKAFAEGRAYFRGKVLMVRPAGKGDRSITRFRSAERARRTAAGRSSRIARGEAIPVALRVTRVTIKRRLHVGDEIRRGLPLIGQEARRGS